MADVPASVVEQDIIQPFGPRRMIISDKANVFTAALVCKLMHSHEIEWKTVDEHARMSIGRAERMVGTVQKSIN